MGQRLGDVLRDIRQRRGLSQSQVAHKAGTVPVYISQLESGVRDNPSAELLARIALALGTTPDHILRRIGTLPNDHVNLSPEVQYLRDLMNQWPEGPLKEEAKTIISSVARILEYVLQNLEGAHGRADKSANPDNDPQGS